MLYETQSMFIKHKLKKSKVELFDANLIPSIVVISDIRATAATTSSNNHFICPV